MHKVPTHLIIGLWQTRRSELEILSNDLNIPVVFLKFQKDMSVGSH